MRALTLRRPWADSVHLGWAVAAALLFYVAAYPLNKGHVPIGSDTPVYVWWSRYAGVTGLGSAALPARPLIIGAIATLSDLPGTPAAWLVSVIGPVLSVANAMAMAAFTWVALGRDRLGFILTLLFVSFYTMFLVAGFFSTLAFSAIFLAGLTCLVWSLVHEERRTVAGAGVLIGAAGLAHPIFMVLGGALIIGGLLGLASGGPPPHWRGRIQESIRKPLPAVLIAIAAVVVGLAFMGGLRAGIPTSADGLLRSLGLHDFLVSAHRERLINLLPPFLVASALAAFLMPSAYRTGRASTTTTVSLHANTKEATRFLIGMFGAWAAVTVVGAVLLFMRVGVPAQRLVMFGLFSPAIAAIAVSRLLRSQWGRFLLAGSGAVRHEATLSILLYIFAIAALAVSYWIPWWGQTPQISARAWSQVRGAAMVLASRPPDTPLILVTEQAVPQFLLDETNYLRATVPPARASDVYAFVGTPSGFLAGQPSLTGAVDQDRIALDSWQRTKPLLDRSPLVVILEAFDPAAYGEALHDDSWEKSSDGVLVLQAPSLGDSGPTASKRSSHALTQPGPGPMSPWFPIWAGALLLVIVTAAGLGWATAMLPGSDQLTRVGVAPAIGFAAFGSASMIVDAAGVRLSGVGGFVAAAVALSSSAVAAAVARRREVASRRRQ
jgi:hypothetical protein